MLKCNPLIFKCSCFMKIVFDAALESVAAPMNADERELLACIFEQWAKQLRLSSLFLRLEKSDCPPPLYHPEKPPLS